MHVKDSSVFFMNQLQFSDQRVADGVQERLAVL
jgi:hypothetical protein